MNPIPKSEKEKFVSKHHWLFKDLENRGIPALIADLARKELGYSKKTSSSDIVVVLNKIYNKLNKQSR